MKREPVASFVDRAAEAIAATPSMRKRNTELRVVEPLLSTLGWDVRSPSVTAAYSAPNGTTVDYALCPEGTVGAFVMVSAAEDELSAERRDALEAAMRAADVPRGLYTNGRRYVLVALAQTGTRPGDDEDGRPMERVELALDALPDRLDALDALSYDAVAAAAGTDGTAVAEALVAADQRAVDAVTERVVDVAREHGAGSFQGVESDVRPAARRFLRTVVDELAPNGVDRESDVEAFADTTRSGHDSERGTTTEANSTTERGTPTEANPTGETGAATETNTATAERVNEGTASSDEGFRDDAPDGGRDGVQSISRASATAGNPEDTEYVLRFFEDGRSVGAVGNPNVDAALAQGVQYLLEERGIGPRIQLPYAPTADDRAFLHREPVHPDGSRMRTAIDIGGVYVATGEPVDDLRAAVEALAERGGLRVMFSGDWE